MHNKGRTAFKKLVSLAKYSTQFVDFMFVILKKLKSDEIQVGIGNKLVEFANGNGLR